MSSVSGASNLWLETPLVRSIHISARLKCDAYLKLENLQPAQSFKTRGISHFAQRAKERYGPSLHLIAASGGNAGIAAAYAANVLNVRCTVFVPEGLSQSVLDRLRKENAVVVIGGKVYTDALKNAEQAAKSDNQAVLVHAYDDPIIWEGHASMVKEIASQLPVKPDGILCSVGGGGLLNGVLLGCQNVGWNDVPVVALETHGANCFYQTLALNEAFPLSTTLASSSLPQGTTTSYDTTYNVKIAHSNPTSRATSLASGSPAAGTVRAALDHPGGVKCVSVPDVMGMQASEVFAEEHKMVVELACGTTLIPACKPTLFRRLFPDTSSSSSQKSEITITSTSASVPPHVKEQKKLTVVFIVCGGTKISLAEMEEYSKIVGADINRRHNDGDDASTWEVACNGEWWSIPKIDE